MNQWGKRIVGIILAALMLFCEPVIYHSIQASAAQMEKRAFGGTFDDADRPATYEVLTGHESQWWTNTVDSHKYRMKKDASPFLFYVRPATNVGLVVELEQDGNYITTCTNHECWLYPGHMQGYVKSVYSSGLWELNSGKEYAIEVARQDHDNKTDYTITITDLETGNVYGKFMAGDTQMTGEPFVYLKAQVGTFEMYFDGPVYQTHGTDRSRIVSLSDVDNTPPADYKIPDGLVRDAKEGAYEKYFPKDSIQTVSVEMDKKNLDYMLQNAVKKPSVMTKSVKIGDTTVGYAGIKTKGNWTLNSTNDTTSDRFSFTINFGKYIKKAAYGKKQNFYGCSKISFNNCYFDKTILKEYNSMRLMDEMGVPAPQYSLAKLYINGEYYGVYFMVEAMDAAIIERYQNASSKEVGSFLVKPSYTSLNYNFEPELENCLNSSQAKEFTMEALEKAGLLTQKDGVYSVHGVLNNYQGMWESDDDTLQDIAEMLPKALTWNRKIQLLSDGKDFEKNKIDVNSKKYRELLDTVMDTDEALRYFAAHSFLVQLDNMFTWKQNYGIYVDKQGKSLFVPWDYDLAWGTANWNGANTAEQVANWDLDKMYPDKFVNVVNFASLTRDEIYKMAPLFYVIYQKNEYKKLNMEAVGNVACVTGSDLSYVVAAAGGSIIKPLPTPSPTEEDKKKPTDGAVKKGQVFTAGKWIYKVTKVTEAGGGEVLMKGLKNKKTKKSLTAATIGANVKIKGRTFKITAVGDKAFAGCGNLKSLTIGKHIKKIGALAFANCKKSKKITIQTKLLTKKSVGKKSFSGIHPRAGIKVPMKKRAAYKKILRSGGAVGKGVSIR